MISSTKTLLILLNFFLITYLLDRMNKEKMFISTSFDKYSNFHRYGLGTF